MAIEFVPNAGQFRDTKTKRFVPRSTVLMAVETEIAKLKNALQGIGRLFASGRIDLEEFQVRMAERIKLGSIQAASLGSGGAAMLNRIITTPLEQRLRNRHGHLRNFAQDIIDGKIDPKSPKFLNRVGQYSEVYRSAFFDAEKRVRASTGFNYARRSLDPGSQHCIECILYDTGGKFLPISEVVPPGTLCSCHGRCRCFITYRQILSPSLASQVLKS